MKPATSKTFWQTIIGFSILLSVLAVSQTVQQVLALGIILWRSKWIVLVSIFALNIIAGMFLFAQLSLGRGTGWLEAFDPAPKNARDKVYGFILFLVGFSLVWLVRLTFFEDILPQIAPIFWVFLWASLLQTVGLKLVTAHKWHLLYVLTVLVQGIIYQIYGHLRIVTDYPFSIGYSEAGRHYYASLFYAKSLYDLTLPLPFLHPTRYFLMSLPFLLNGLPLWFHRLWQVFLWIGLTAVSSSLLVRRLSLKGGMQFFMAAWAFLYFFQGAVYYHLHICVIIILAGVSTRHPWRSVVSIILASIWAGVSRVNWFPVPAILAIAIYLLETSFVGKGWRYWFAPFLWGVSGLLAAVISQFIYISISGNADVRSFGSSFTSDLLWDRLLPNETFPMGILLGIALVSAPLIVAFIQMVYGKFSRIHLFRWAALFALLFVLFLGGLIVSVKIGGGADLHNMDAFLVLLALIVTSFLAGQVAAEGVADPVWGQLHWPIIIVAFLIPIGFAISQIGFLPRYDHVNVEKDIQKLQKAASAAVEGGGEVLFVTERQLLTFKILKDIPLIPDYEQSELMEMAMSGNREYLTAFYSDLKQHRFTIIIAEEQKFTLQKKGAFIEENNAWVRYVGAPILCAYKPVESLTSANVQVFVPRPVQPSCRDPFSE
jgi:hypothetical protein